MVKGGAKKSLTAAPSRRNSGLKQSPRPLPISRPTMASSLGATRSSVVLGATVERTTTLCASFLWRMACPIEDTTASSAARDWPPPAPDGVPHEISQNPLSITAPGALADRKRGGEG